MSISGCMTLIALVMPLPANIMGQLFDDTPDAYFAKTTIGNLSNSNALLWVHVVAGCLMYGIAFYFMRRFSHYDVKGEPDQIGSTLMLRGLPDTMTKERIERHFEQAYGCQLEQVKLNYDTAKVIELNEQLKKKNQAKQLAEERLNLTGERPG